MSVSLFPHEIYVKLRSKLYQTKSNKNKFGFNLHFQLKFLTYQTKPDMKHKEVKELNLNFSATQRTKLLSFSHPKKQKKTKKPNKVDVKNLDIPAKLGSLGPQISAAKFRNLVEPDAVAGKQVSQTGTWSNPDKPS